MRSGLAEADFDKASICKKSVSRALFETHSDGPGAEEVRLLAQLYPPLPIGLFFIKSCLRDSDGVWWTEAPASGPQSSTPRYNLERLDLIERLSFTD
ncbi:hypothetical protein AVEN_81892-1 [Araneus ventricosus]|uniref:Uncharacterized protein n=1 Tax=Araneus ventricosus TaxID=182803 RepID=A0A4Y2I3I2_ARAVE|nr:hypothetical protein AVEN_81892-1 [Araneus ventricosus]